MRSRLASWLLFKLFLWASKNASFNDFTIIYNQAYHAFVKSEFERTYEAVKSEIT